MILLSKTLRNQLKPSLWTHVKRFLHTHTPTIGPALLSTSEPLCNQASQEGSFWTREGPTLVREQGSERSFQVTSSGVRTGGPHWGSYTCACVIGKQQSLSYEVIPGWTAGGNCLQEPAKSLWGCFTFVYVCGIKPSPLKASRTHFLSSLPCFPYRPDTLNNEGSRVSSKALTPSERNAWAGCWHSHRQKHMQVHTHARNNP